MTTKLQTAGNNAILKAVKAKMNAKTYKHFRTEMAFTGVEGAMGYLSQFFTAESWPRVRAELESVKLS